MKGFHHIQKDKAGYAAGILLMLAAAVLPVAAGTETLPPLSPGPGDKCPVCGMFVAKYPDWTAQVRFRNRRTVFFDGAKDLFRYYFSIGRYYPGKSVADVVAVYVTDYYTLEPVAAATAFFVAGSDVHGPMGRELIAFASVEQAQEFRRDHRGREVLRFEAVSPELLRSLD